ncbi:hypothetical protein PVL29_003695 [Vitis rotundifolia]|uniref:NB-ARC domain-containing protein n=1 Tax=Vitis rotundifolia TaxID=103349 RepID=A0AA39E3F4_VITRO|nr:hypothetical protein PVL29_003695 [Vitis rotundifolia]
MSADHLEFLKSKFMEDLRDAEEEHTGANEIPLHSHFLQIRDDCLYNAISALEECVILSEKREPRKKDGPLHGCTPAELWPLCRAKRLLLKIKKNLESSLASTSDGAVSSSSISLPKVMPRPDSDWDFRHWKIRGFGEQEEEIRDELEDWKKWGKGFKKIGIVGTELVFTNRKVVNFFHYRIWICLSRRLTARDGDGDGDLKEMVRDMLQQCGVKYDRLQDVAEDDLLENLKNALMGNKYLIVFDGIWDIKMDWYLKLGDRLEESESSAGVIITTRLPHVPKQMGMHLHHMAPPIPEEVLFHLTFEEGDFLHHVVQKMKDEIIQQCDGLPLAAQILSKIIPNQMFGER